MLKIVMLTSYVTSVEMTLCDMLVNCECMSISKSIVFNMKSMFFFFLFFFVLLMIRRPPRSTLDRSSAASDVYKRQADDKARTFLERIQSTLGDQGFNIDKVAESRVACTVLRLARGVRLQAVDPVSYTHLRAHETVLDLVCRLLLEKKKKSKVKENKNPLIIRSACIY